MSDIPDQTLIDLGALRTLFSELADENIRLRLQGQSGVEAAPETFAAAYRALDWIDQVIANASLAEPVVNPMPSWPTSLNATAKLSEVAPGTRFWIASTEEDEIRLIEYERLDQPGSTEKRVKVVRLRTRQGVSGQRARYDPGPYRVETELPAAMRVEVRL